MAKEKTPQNHSQPQWMRTREPAQAVRDVKALFAEHFSGEADGVWSAPAE